MGTIFSPSSRVAVGWWVLARNFETMEAAAEVISEEQLKTEIGHFKAHLLSVCSALGGQVGGEYVPGDEVVDCLKDLKRYLKDEDGQVYADDLVL